MKTIPLHHQARGASARIKHHITSTLVWLCLLALMPVAQTTAQTVFTATPKTFEFGPGTPNTRSNMRTFSLPAWATIVRVYGTFSAGGAERVNVDLHKPSAESVDSTGPDGPYVASAGAQITGIPASGSFSMNNFGINNTSEFGCPSTWRVRVRSQLSNPTIRVAGTIYVDYIPPPQRILSIAGDGFDIDADTTATARAISTSQIDGTGSFRIKAKWHADAWLGTFAPVTVKLLRPNGTTAKTQTGWSQHAPADKTPKLDFTYAVSAADALLPGSWFIQVTNPQSFDILNFNIDDTDDGAFDDQVPNFNSTFTASCAGGFEITPEEREARVHETLNYAYKWIVPDPQNWNDLRWIQLRIRDGSDIVMWLKFDVLTRTFSVLNEGNGRFGKGFAAGTRTQLQTNKATLHLAGSSVVAAGPTSPIVTLNLQLSLKPGTAGRVLAIDVAAQENAEEASEFSDCLSPAGTIVVLPKK
ncbi:MAG: hypothetical protein JNJ83_06210 [Verrucomicrobiaceae bacterium]|nr:hypothetical protein [Verrucomicrobiaceae bacterium]